MKRNPNNKTAAVSGVLGGKPRYSNYVGGPDMSIFTDLGTSGDYSELPQNGSGTNTGLGQDTSGSGFWGSLPGLINSVGSVVSSIWGKSDGYVANMYSGLYQQEKKTTNLLIGILVALVLLAFVFIIIKKK